MDNEDKLLIGGISRSNWDDIPMANPVQQYVDNNQEAINNLSEINPLKYAAQATQDVANIVAHPVQYSKNMFNYFKEDPRRLNAGFTLGEQAGNIVGQLTTQPLNKSLAQISGMTLGSVPLAMLSGGTTFRGSIPRTQPRAAGFQSRVNLQPTNQTSKTLSTFLKRTQPSYDTVSVEEFLNDIPYKPNIPSIKKGVTTEQFIKPNTTFEEYILNLTGADPKKVGLYANQKINTSNVRQGVAGSYNPKTNEIHILPEEQLKAKGLSKVGTESHEKGHRVMGILDNLEKMGLNTSEGSELYWKLKNSQSNKIQSLKDNEAISRAFEKIADPNIQFNKDVLDSIFVTPEDINSAYDVLSQYYNRYKGL